MPMNQKLKEIAIVAVAVLAVGLAAFEGYRSFGAGNDTQAGAAAQDKKIMAASSHTQNLLSPADYKAKVTDLAMSPGAKKQSNRQ